MNATANWQVTSSQQGAALIVSMVMLLVITVIGVAVMSGSHLELMMSNNSQLQSSSYLNAEVVLDEAGKNLTPPPATPGPPKNLATPDPADNIANWVNNALSPAPTPVTLGGSVIGSYEIKHLGYNVYTNPTDPTSYIVSTSPCILTEICVDVYRIWAYGTDAKGAKTLLKRTVIFPTGVITTQSRNTVQMP